MSLMRRFSRKLSGKKNDDSKALVPKARAPVTLSDAPVPNQRQMTTASLFQPHESSSIQATSMDRALYEIPQPSQVDAMTDLIKDHEKGTLFPYVGVVGSEGESSDARRARLLALKPSYNKRDIPEIKVLGCPLIDREGDFTMKTLMSFAQSNSAPVPASYVPMPSGVHRDYSITKAYVHIRQVTVLFTPNTSSSSNYCRFWMNLVDNRLIDGDKGSQTNVVVSNQESILEMSCDYCVSVADLESFTLSYTLERDIVHPGFQWAAASFYFSITESDLPFQTSKVDAMGVYRMPITTLMERKTNADKSDISFTPADLVELRKLYRDGGIVDVDEPQTARLKTNTYSKSSIRGKPKGEEISVEGKKGWDFMTGARRPQMDANIASEDAESVDLPEVDLEAAARNRREQVERYKAKQEEERIAAQELVALETGKRSPSIKSDNTEVIPRASDEENELSRFFSDSKGKKKVMFGSSGV